MPKPPFADDRAGSNRRFGQSARALVAAALAFVCAVGAAATLTAQTPVTNGYRDFSFGSKPTSTPTGEKPESKLWWNDGSWWGIFFSTAANEYHIYELDLNSQAWTDTGTRVDTRANSRADTLWDESSGRLYITSHVFTTSASASASSWGQLYRFTYAAGSRRYTLDSGFPVNVTRGKEETLTIAKDSTGRLWVTYVESGKVKINWSRTSDTDWGTPVDLPAPSSAISVYSDDISDVIAFDGNKIGVMWSNQLLAKTFFVARYDTDAPDVWQAVEQVIPGNGCSGACADDHFNLKTDSTGRVFAATKTSLTATTSPLAMLAVRSAGPAPSWTAYTFGLVKDHHTRPIVLLDEGANTLYMFATSGESGGTIYLKTSPLDAISFASGLGDPFIKSATDTAINNATSTKQNLDATTGLVVIASDKNTHYYLHGYLPLDGTVVPQDMPAAPSGLSAQAVSETQVDLSWTDNSTNEDSFSVERATGGGAFSVLATTGANTSTFSDTTAQPSTAYSYRVRAMNSSGASSYSNTADVTTPSSGGGGGGGGGGGTSSPIKSITFEAGTLTDAATGADKVTGTVTLESASPLDGSYSARVPGAATSYLEESFASADDLYVSLRIRVNALPSADARIVLVSSAGTTIGNIVLRTSGRLRLRVDATTIGSESVALEAGQVYRIGIHQKRGTGSDAVLEAFVAPDGQAFGSAFSSTSAGAWTGAADRLRIGATNPSAVDVALDDILLDAGTMPGL